MLMRSKIEYLPAKSLAAGLKCQIEFGKSSPMALVKINIKNLFTPLPVMHIFARTI